jgi:hypothetical protein
MKINAIENIEKEQFETCWNKVIILGIKIFSMYILLEK